MQGTCIDPNYPYCDLDGSIGGTPGACIAVTCMTGEFAKCSGDSALMCNQFGTGYEEVTCAHGCDENTGCRLCEANQTVCANGAVATCDANGNQTAVTQCPLGCFEDQPRCREIDPSNNLGSYLGAVANPPDVDLSVGSYIVYSDSGKFFDGSGNLITMPSFVAVQTGGPPIRVFVANKLTLGNVTVNIEVQTALPPFPAIAFLAKDDLSLVGHLSIRNGVGSLNLAECVGGDGTYIEGGPFSGGGGGGFATVGAHGGMDSFVGGAGGGISGNDILVPLRGGCASGGHRDDNSSNVADGTAGGGAVQLVSRTHIKVAPGAQIDASGPGGDWDQRTGACGGGAGGAILLEAPTVELGDGAKLLTPGGDGAAGDGGG